VRGLDQYITKLAADPLAPPPITNGTVEVATSVMLLDGDMYVEYPQQKITDGTPDYEGIHYEGPYDARVYKEDMIAFLGPAISEEEANTDASHQVFFADIEYAGAGTGGGSGVGVVDTTPLNAEDIVSVQFFWVTDSMSMNVGYHRVTVGAMHQIIDKVCNLALPSRACGVAELPTKVVVNHEEVALTYPPLDSIMGRVSDYDLSDVFGDTMSREESEHDAVHQVSVMGLYM
jgi:hypothetical protein